MNRYNSQLAQFEGGNGLAQSFKFNLIFKESNPNDKSQFRHNTTALVDALGLRNELVHLLQAEIYQESCLRLGLQADTVNPHHRRVVTEYCSQQIDVLINISYEVDNGICNATLTGVSLQPLEETIKQFVQKYLEKPDDQITFTETTEKRKIRCMRQLEFVLQSNGLGRYFELMGFILQQVSLAFRELRNNQQFWRERHINPLEAQCDAYPSVPADEMLPYYRLIRSGFAEDHCFFKKINQLIRRIHVGAQGNLDATILQALDLNIHQQKRLILQLKQTNQHYLYSSPRKKGDKIILKVLLISHLYRYMLTKEEHKKCSLRYFGQLGKNRLSDVVEQWEKDIKGQGPIKLYISTFLVNILEEIQNYCVDMCRIDAGLFQDILEITKNFRQTQFYEKEFFQVWQNFVMSTWIGDFKVLLRRIFTFMKNNLANLTEEKVEASHQEYFRIFSQVLLILGMTKVIYIVSDELQRYYEDLIRHLRTMLHDVNISRQFIESQRDKRIALLLVNVYANLTLWNSLMPQETNKEFRRKIYYILKDYQRSGEQGIQQVQGDQGAFADLGPVHEIYMQLLDPGNQEEKLRRLIEMIKSSYRQQKIIYDDRKINEFIEIVCLLEENR